MKVSCLIPFFNERERIGKVLEQVIKVASIDEIVCVDDGSTDGTAAFITKVYPQVKVINSPHNEGKSAAVKRGTQKAKGDFIFLLDADLRDITASEIASAITKVRNHDVDMIIMRRINALWSMKLVRGDILVSGDRIIRKSLLEKVLQQKVEKFQLEFAINQFLLDNKGKAYWMPTSARNTYKFSKVGFFKGWYEMIAVSVDILSYVGLRNYLKQLFFFCRRELM